MGQPERYFGALLFEAQGYVEAGASGADGSTTLYVGWYTDPLPGPAAPSAGSKGSKGTASTAPPCFSHLRRRNVPSRPGLGLDEKAEFAPRPASVSMRAMSRRMGVDRKGVRLALVEAGLIVDRANGAPVRLVGPDVTEVGAEPKGRLTAMTLRHP